MKSKNSKLFTFFQNRLTLTNGPAKYNITEDSLWLFSTIPTDKISYLDVGCATGILSLMLSIIHPKSKITAIDIQEEMINRAFYHSKINNIDNINFQNLDLFQIGQTFDCVFSNPPFFDTKSTCLGKDNLRNTAHFQADFQLFLNKLIKLVNNNGILCFMGHTTTRKQILKTLQNKYNLLEISLISSKNKAPKRFLYIVDKSKNNNTYTYKEIYCYNKNIRNIILSKHQPIFSIIN